MKGKPQCKLQLNSSMRNGSPLPKRTIQFPEIPIPQRKPDYHFFSPGLLYTASLIMSLHPGAPSLEEDVAAWEASRGTAAAAAAAAAAENGGNRLKSPFVDDAELRLNKEDDARFLGGVLERRTTADMFIGANKGTPGGFPTTFEVEKGEKRKGKVSLFKQMMMQRKNEVLESRVSESFEVNGDKIVAGMTPDEIRVAQQEIYASFDEGILERFMAAQNKKKTKKKKDEGEKEKEKEKVNESQEETEAKLKDISWIRTEDDLEKAMNMLPEREKEKLRWTGRIREANDEPDVESLQDKDKLFGADFVPSSSRIRFDFDGNYINPSDFDRISVTAALHHHGEEPDKPGYTMAELVTLSRSTNAAQKRIALSCLSGILKNRKNCLESRAHHPIFSLPVELGLSLRLALDDSNPVVVAHALEAMKAFLIPERFFDDHFENAKFAMGRFLPEKVPRAQGSPDVYAKEFDEENDRQQAGRQGAENEADETDALRIVRSPVLGFLHAGILFRLEFLLGCKNEFGAGVELSPAHKAIAWDMVSFIVMHSDSSFSKVLEHRALLKDLMNAAAIMRQEDEEAQARLRLIYTLTLARLSEGTNLNERMRGALRTLADSFDSPLALAVLDLTQRETSCQKRTSQIISEIKRGRLTGFIAAHRLLETTFEKATIGFWREFVLFSDATAPARLNWNDESLRLLTATAIDALIDSVAEVKIPESGPFEIDDLQQLDRNLQLMELLSSLSRREEARSQLYQILSDSSMLHLNLWHLLFDLETDPADPMDVKSLCKQRIVTMLWIRTAQLLLRVFGSTVPDESTPIRARLISELMPQRDPQCSGNSWVAFELVRALLDPSLKLVRSPESVKVMLDSFRASLGGVSSLNLSMGMTALCSGTQKCPEELMPVSMRLGSLKETFDKPKRKLNDLLRKRWTESRSAWILTPLYVAFEESVPSSFVSDALKACYTLLEVGSVRGEDIIIFTARLLSRSDLPVFDDPHVINVWTNLLDLAIRKVVRDEETPFEELLLEATGGRSQFVQVVEKLITAYNERLNGHAAATAVLLLLVSPKVLEEVRLVIWTELLGANLLRLLQPSSRLRSLQSKAFFTENQESNEEIIRVMVTSLRERALTNVNNPFMYDVVVRILAAYFWLNKFSWSKRRLWKELVIAQSYIDIAKAPIGNVFSGGEVHPNAVRALRVVAKNDPASYQQIHRDGLIELED